MGCCDGAGARIECCSQVSISESNWVHEDQRPGTTVAQLLVGLSVSLVSVPSSSTIQSIVDVFSNMLSLAASRSRRSGSSRRVKYKLGTSRRGEIRPLVP